MFCRLQKARLSNYAPPDERADHLVRDALQLRMKFPEPYIGRAGYLK